MEFWIKIVTLFFGLVCMGLERFQPWHLENPQAVFAFGAGLVVCPLALHWCELIRATCGKGGE